MSKFDLIHYPQPVYPQSNQLVPNYPTVAVLEEDMAPAVPKAAYGCKQKKANTMAHEIYNDVTLDVQAQESDATKARARLSMRARDIYYQLDRELEKKFGLRGDDRPKSFTEFQERIKAGKYVLDDKHKKSLYWMDYIEWRDPSITRDDDGYAKAEEALKKAFTATEDEIAVFGPEEGLASLRKFETWKLK